MTTRCKPRIYLLILFLTTSTLVQAEYIWTANCITAWEQLSRLNFKETERLLTIEKSRRPANLIPLYIESQADFIRTFIFEEKNTFETLKAENDNRIRKFEKDETVSPYQRFCIAEMYLQLTVARIKFKEYLGAAYDVRKSFRLLEENRKRYPDFTPNLRGLGLIHAAVGAVPKNYQWMAGILGLNGSIHQGLTELRTLYTSTKSNNEFSFLKEETIVMLTFLEINLGKEKNLQPLRQRFYQQKVSAKNHCCFLPSATSMLMQQKTTASSASCHTANVAQKPDSSPICCTWKPMPVCTTSTHRQRNFISNTSSNTKANHTVNHHCNAWPGGD